MRWIFIFLLGVSLLTPTFAVPSPAVQEYKLANGLRLLVKEDHRAASAVMMVWYKVGSAYEQLGTTGISHALEHMMFKGTPRFGVGQYFKLIADAGGDSNANTSRDYTVYYTKIAAEQLPLCFELEADRMKNLNLDPAEFAKEIQVVKAERTMRTDDNPQALTYERLNAAAYLNTPYHNPVVGWPVDLQNMNIADLRHWYQAWYAPNNAIIVVVGDVDPQKILQLAEQNFGKIPASTLPIIKPIAEVAPLGERTLEVKAPAKLPWILLAYPVPVLNTTQNKTEVYALAVLNNILDGGASSRLQQLIQQQQTISDANVAYNPFSLYSELFLLDGTPSLNHTSLDVKNLLLAQVAKLQHDLVSTDELNRVKTQLIAQKIYAQDSLLNAGMQIGSLESVGLPWQTKDTFISNVQAVTPEEIRAVAQKYLTLDHLTIATLNPLPIKGDNLPTTFSGANDVR